VRAQCQKILERHTTNCPMPGKETPRLDHDDQLARNESRAASSARPEEEPEQDGRLEHAQDGYPHQCNAMPIKARFRAFKPPFGSPNC